MTHITDEHEMIYLEPACCAEPDEGRRWCQDADVFDCDDGVAPTRFIRADLVTMTAWQPIATYDAMKKKPPAVYEWLMVISRRSP